MPRHLERELQQLRKNLLSMAALVEESGHLAVQGLVERDVALAQRVIETDQRVDEMEVEVEEECLKILALHQPVAVDLRYVIAILKINNDLERIGDLATNIAKRAIYLTRHPKVAIPVDLQAMAKLVYRMVRNALDALVNYDAGLARSVCASDDEVDDYNRQMYDHIKDAIQAGRSEVLQLFQLLTVSRYLERIADQATNIAEDVIYLVEGEIVRHVKQAALQEDQG